MQARWRSQRQARLWPAAGVRNPLPTTPPPVRNRQRAHRSISAAGVAQATVQNAQHANSAVLCCAVQSLGGKLHRRCATVANTATAFVPQSSKIWKEYAANPSHLSTPDCTIPDGPRPRTGTAPHGMRTKLSKVCHRCSSMINPFSAWLPGGGGLPLAGQTPTTSGQNKTSRGMRRCLTSVTNTLLR
jgi:hypothetical protein